jgi:sRNA-binding carbon storage regulator CsrA
VLWLMLIILRRFRCTKMREIMTWDDIEVQVEKELPFQANRPRETSLSRNAIAQSIQRSENASAMSPRFVPFIISHS